jgi:hypothetical protein
LISIWVLFLFCIDKIRVLVLIEEWKLLSDLTKTHEGKEADFWVFFFFGLFGGNRPNGLKVFGISMFLPNGFIRVLVPI